MRAPLAPRRFRFRCAVWPCVLGFWFRLRPASPSGGVGVCVCSCARPAWSPAPPGWGCCAGVRVCARAPLVTCLSWLGCGVWACVLGPGLGCAPPFLVGLSGCVFCAFFFWACLGLALWCRLLAVPVPGLVVPVPPSPSFWSGLLARFFFPAWCVSACFSVPFPGGPLFLAWCCRFWLGCPPVPILGVLSSVPSGWGVWSPLVVLAGGLVAVGCSLAPSPPPPLFFFLGGGAACSSLCLPGLAHALARIQCGLPGCCWRLRCAWPCSGPMGRVGYVHVGLGAPSCRVRSWLCRLGGCAQRLRVALGWRAGVVRFLSPLRCRFETSGSPASVVAGRAVAPCVACDGGVWRAGAAPSRVCGGLFRLVLQVRVSRAVLCRSVPRRVASCCCVLHSGALWCGVPWSRVVPLWVSGGQPGLCCGAECGPECGWLVAGGCG